MRKKLLMLLTLLLPVALLLAGAAPRQVMLYEFGDKGLTQYLHAAEDCPAAWRVMIALDLVQENDLSAPQKDELIQRTALFSGCESEEDALDCLTPALRGKVEGALAHLSYMRAVVEGKRYCAVTNIGVRPTVEGRNVTVEPWILDYDGDLYGREITLEFYRFLRPERKFPSLDDLKAEIHRNAGETRAYFGE